MVLLTILVALVIIATVVLSFVPERHHAAHLSKTRLGVSTIVYGSIGFLFLILALFTSVFFTSEQDIGFTSTFGKTTMIDGAGIHFKPPFISEKHIYDATTKGMAIGYSEETNESEVEDSLMITSDFNLANIDFFIEYRITDPIEYCYGSDNPEEILRNVSQAAIKNTVGQHDIDSVMTTGKAEIETLVSNDILAELDNHKTGLTVVNVTIQDSEPPTAEVAAAFKDVENAKQNADTVVNNALEDKNTRIPEAEAKAEAIKQAANATKTERINEAKEEVANFNALFAEYERNPDTVRKRLYYESLAEILPKMEIIIGKDSKVVYLKDSLNPNQSSSTSNSDDGSSK